MTVKYQDGYLIQGAGISGRPISQRFREHTREYLNGIYNVLDIGAMQNGKRKEVWHGFWMGKERSAKKQEDFDKRRFKIIVAVCRLFAGYRIFAANIGSKRIRERLEAAIMDNLRDKQQPEPFRVIPDEGMHLMRRSQSEPSITINNRCSVKLHGLPRVLEI